MSERIKELIRALQGRAKVDFGGDHAKKASATKRGPGRYCDGLKAYRAPHGPGIGAQWLGERTNTERNNERALKRELGARQFKRLTREQRRAQQP